MTEEFVPEPLGQREVDFSECKLAEFYDSRPKPSRKGPPRFDGRGGSRRGRGYLKAHLNRAEELLQLAAEALHKGDPFGNRVLVAKISDFRKSSSRLRGYKEENPAQEELPHWELCKIRTAARRATPLEKFIYHNEPRGKVQEEEFRKELKELLDYVRNVV